MVAVLAFISGLLLGSCAGLCIGVLLFARISKIVPMTWSKEPPTKTGWYWSPWRLLRCRRSRNSKSSGRYIRQYGRERQRIQRQGAVCLAAFHGLRQSAEFVYRRVGRPDRAAAMNKWRRLHKQRQRRMLYRLRAIKAWLRRGLIYGACVQGAAHINTLRSMSADRFEGGPIGKTAAIAAAAIKAHEAIVSAWNSIR